MPNTRSGRDIDSALVRKGFQRFRDGDHVRYRFYEPDNDNPLTRTKISHGMMGDTIGAKLLSEMARQLRLTKTQFLALIDCTLDEEGYRQILQNEEEYYKTKRNNLAGTPIRDAIVRLGCVKILWVWAVPPG
jgi:hypothetical protein